VKVGDIVMNEMAIGVSKSWRPAGHRGLIINLSKAMINMGPRIGEVATTDILVLLDDGTLNTYDSKSFRLVDN